MTTSMLDHKVWASRIVASLKRFSPSGKYRFIRVEHKNCLFDDWHCGSGQVDVGWFVTSISAKKLLYVIPNRLSVRVGYLLQDGVLFSHAQYPMSRGH